MKQGQYKSEAILHKSDLFPKQSIVVIKEVNNEFLYCGKRRWRLQREQHDS